MKLILPLLTNHSLTKEDSLQNIIASKFKNHDDGRNCNTIYFTLKINSLPNRFLAACCTLKGIEAVFLSTVNMCIKTTYNIPDILPRPTTMKLIKKFAIATTQDRKPSGPRACFF